MSLCFEELPGLIPCRLHPPDLRGLMGASIIDTRRLQPGEVFWALKGASTDGHDYVFDAFNKGAQAAVVAQSWFERHRDSLSNSPCVVVTDPLGALQELAKAHRSRFRKSVIALTGSNGKTAVKELIAAALRSRYKLLKSPGNYNNHIGLPLTLLQIEPDTDIVLTEMGTNQPGDIELLCSIARPDHGMVLNIGPAHLEKFGDLEGVAREKETLLRSIAPEGTVFINTDDPYVRQMKSSARHRICFGFRERADDERCNRTIKAQRLDMTPEGKGRFRFQDVTFEMSWYGLHQVDNGLAAAVVADYFAVPVPKIAEIFASMTPVGGRLNVEKIDGWTLINDTYNANPASTAAALEFLRALPVSGRRYVVLGDHLELGKAAAPEHRRLGKRLAEGDIAGVFLVGTLVKFTAETAGDLVKMLLEDTADLTPLAERISEIIKPGDALLVKASRGMRLERLISLLKTITVER